jgi:hypothetical protein
VRFHSSTTPEFWQAYKKQPATVREWARKTYRLWSEEALHPSLHFKKIKGGKWSVRIGIHYRAVGRFEADGFAWDWDRHSWGIRSASWEAVSGEENVQPAFVKPSTYASAPA